MLTKYGIDNILIMITTGILLIVLGFYFNKIYLTIIFISAGILLIFFTLWFFRDPERIVPQEALENERIVISPADGKIVEIVEEIEPLFLKEKSIRISIFLSPLNVHVNRIPMSGTVKYFEYISGDYYVAYHPKSSLENEQTHIGIENSYGKLFFKQIVGILARRLAWDIKLYDKVKVGQRFGMMKFGSRMDIALPYNSKITVKIGDKVTAGLTKLGEL